MSVNCCMELLEERRLLAGNVTVVNGGGILRIVGDKEGNDIRLEGTDVRDGPIKLIARNTTINGRRQETKLLNMVQTITINLGRGDNKLVMSGLNPSVVVRSGDGNDFVQLNNSHIEGDLWVFTHGGRDVVSLFGDPDSSVERARIETGDDDDLIDISGVHFQKKLAVRAGRGDDSLFRENNETPLPPVIKLGPGKDKDGGAHPQDSVRMEWYFDRGAEGWKAGLADYPRANKSGLEAKTGIRKTPASLGGEPAAFISAKNISDDLFMFLFVLPAPYELEPNTAYQLHFDIQLGSNAESGCAGIGGAPGESVYLKAGASMKRPKLFEDEDGMVRLNVDHGQQASGGTSTFVLGNIANGVECGTSTPGAEYVSIHRSGVLPRLVRTNAKGRIYVLVGTDSGFEGRTSLFYQHIFVNLVRAWKEPPKPRPFSERYVPVS